MQVAHKQDKPTEKKILSELTQAELKSIQIRLNNISLAIGISGVTEKDVMDLIVSLLPKYYPRMTMETITQAFIDNAAGKLLCRENGKDIEKFVPFNSFDWNFVCNVLNAWEQTEMRKKSAPPKAKSHEYQLPPADPFTTMKADFLVLLKWIKDLGDILPEQANYHDAFVFCQKAKIIQLSDQEYKEIVVDARHQVTIMCDEAKNPSERRDIRNLYDDELVFKNLCRKTAFKQWIQDKMIYDEDFINKLIGQVNSI